MKYELHSEWLCCLSCRVGLLHVNYLELEIASCLYCVHEANDCQGRAGHTNLEKFGIWSFVVLKWNCVLMKLTLKLLQNIVLAWKLLLLLLDSLRIRKKICDCSLCYVKFTFVTDVQQCEINLKYWSYQSAHLSDFPHVPYNSGRREDKDFYKICGCIDIWPDGCQEEAPCSVSLRKHKQFSYISESCRCTL